MRKNILLFLCMCLCTFVYAQADKMPQAISYQAVARDAAGKVLTEKSIGVKVEILKGSTSGTVAYSETHTPTSSKTGTITLLIGQGTASTGTFASIDWGADTYFLKLSMDVAGGSTYKEVSTTQMLPAPFALYAAKAGSVENGGSGSPIKYTFASNDDPNIYKALAGKIEEEAWENNQTTAFLKLEFDLLYLDGIDQNIDCEITGMPDNITLGSDYWGVGQSSFAGRHIDWRYDGFPIGTHSLKLVLKKEGAIIKECPFKFVVKQYPTN